MHESRSTEAVVLIGTGTIGQAIARRIAPGKHLLLADVRESNAMAASDTLSSVGYRVSTQLVDVSSREAVHALATAPLLVLTIPEISLDAQAIREGEPNESAVSIDTSLLQKKRTQN